MKNRHLHPENREDLKGLFAEKFGDFEPETDRDLWPEIFEKIPRDTGGSFNFLPYAIPLALAAAFALLFWFGGKFTSESTEAPSTYLAQSNNKIVAKKQSTEDRRLRPEDSVQGIEDTELRTEGTRLITEDIKQIETVHAEQSEEGIMQQTEQLKDIEDQAAIIKQHPNSKEWEIEGIKVSSEELVKNKLDLDKIIPDHSAKHDADSKIDFKENSSAKKIALNKLDFEKVVVFAADKLNKNIPDIPVKAEKTNIGKNQGDIFSFKLGSISIVKKKHIKSDKSTDI